MKPTIEQKEHIKQVTVFLEELVQIAEGKIIMEDKDYSLLSDEMVEYRDACLKKQQEALEKLQEEIEMNEGNILVSAEQLEARYLVDDKEDKNED